VWMGHYVEGYYYTRRQTGLWFTQTQGEGIVLKVAWHRVSNSSVVSDPFGKPGSSPLNVGLPSAWGSVDGGHVFALFRWRAS
jgi:hypothetical protein